MTTTQSEEGNLPRHNQGNHPEVQRMKLQEDTALRERILHTHSKYNPDFGNGEGMWMTQEGVSATSRGYNTDNDRGGWKSHCPYDCGRSSEPCPMTDQGKKPCKEIADLYPAHDPTYIEPREIYGVKNTRYQQFEAAGNNWIKRPTPIHSLAHDITLQERDVNWKMGHYRESLSKFIAEEGRTWEARRTTGQTHPLDTMAIGNQVDEEIAFREYFLMQAHTIHNEHMSRKAQIEETGTPEQRGNFLREYRPPYEYQATRTITTCQALQHSMDTLASLQKELARVLNVKSPTPPRRAEMTYNIKCFPPREDYAGRDRRKQRVQSGQSLSFGIKMNDRSTKFGREGNSAHIHYYSNWHTLNLAITPPQNQYQDKEDYLRHWTIGQGGSIIPATSVEEQRIQIKIDSDQLEQFTDQKGHITRRKGGNKRQWQHRVDQMLYTNTML